MDYHELQGIISAMCETSTAYGEAEAFNDKRTMLICFSQMERLNKNLDTFLASHGVTP